MTLTATPERVSAQAGEGDRDRDRRRPAAEQAVAAERHVERVDADRLRPRLDRDDAGCRSRGTARPILCAAATSVRSRLATWPQFVGFDAFLAFAAADDDVDRERFGRRVGVERPALDPHLPVAGRAGQFELADRVRFADRRRADPDRGAVDVVAVDVDRDRRRRCRRGRRGTGGCAGGWPRRSTAPPSRACFPGCSSWRSRCRRGAGSRCRELVGEVGDPGAARGVDAGLVAEFVQLRRPRFEEGEDGLGRAGGRRVGLHVEVDRAAGADPDRGRLGRPRLRPPPSPCVPAATVVILAQLAAARGGRLEADVGGDQVPARGGLGADPAGAEVGLRAGAVFAADVDADAAEGRFGPGRHRLAWTGRCRCRSRGR